MGTTMYHYLPRDTIIYTKHAVAMVPTATAVAVAVRHPIFLFFLRDRGQLFDERWTVDGWTDKTGVGCKVSQMYVVCETGQKDVLLQETDRKSNLFW